jgi:citrate lyase subunit beta/citryl-CoA lyase
VRARSWLYVPAHEPRKIAKSTTSGADVVILDLEDATPADRKAAGRDCVRGALADEDFGRSRRYVRINAVGSEHWRDDVEATLGAADGYVLPKASSAATVRSVAELVRAQAVPLAVIATEDVEGVFALNETIAADPLVETVMWGSEDLSDSLGAWRVKDDAGELLDVFRLVRSMALLAGARHGKAVVDTVFLTIGDLDGLRSEARRMAEMGFSGKQAIHPEQIAVINDAFTPSDEELLAARELVAAFEQEGAAVVRRGDEMADNPHLLRARRLLALVEDAE